MAAARAPTWDDYVDVLKEGGKVGAAAILGPDGSVWAQSRDDDGRLLLTEEEAPMVAAGMEVGETGCRATYLIFGGVALQDPDAPLSDVGVGYEARVELGPDAAALRRGGAEPATGACVLSVTVVGPTGAAEAVDVPADGTVGALAAAAARQLLRAGAVAQGPVSREVGGPYDFRCRGVYARGQKHMCLRYSAEDGVCYAKRGRQGLCITRSSRGRAIIVGACDGPGAAGDLNVWVEWVKDHLNSYGY